MIDTHVSPARPAERRFSSRQITTMVVAICCAVVLLPIGAVAATGSLVNITDPVYTARKARVDTAGRLNVSDQGVVTRTILQEINFDCGAVASGHLFILDTSGYSSIRIMAYNPGPSQAILEVSPAVNGAAVNFPALWKHTMPHSTSTEVTHVIDTPPAQTAVRVYFCSAGFRIMVFGSR